MLFNSFGYLIFLPVVVVLFWLSPGRLRPLLLLVASYIFYMVWKPIYVFLILGLTILNYVAGRIIGGSQDKSRFLFLLAIVLNLAVLGVFKYAYFALDLANVAISPLGLHCGPLPVQIILPLGISFFVFEFIHYLAEVYKGRPAITSFVEFALFPSFFPTQIAGPIKRYQDFVPQLHQFRKFNVAYLDQGVYLILFGLFKKVIFADNLATIVQSAFDHAELLTSLDLWLAVYAFAFQIYFDFSGYTDIARGSAQLLGFSVPANFNLPYMAGSIAEFWHRWHMSLSTWLRDYLYIPLGGSKGSQFFVYRNLFLTMLLGGLWHGAAMHFVVWGAYQGILLIAHREWQRISSGAAWLKQLKQTKLFHLLAIVVTFHAVCIGWVFFRADTFKLAVHIVEKLLFFVSAPHSLPRFALSIVATKEPVIFMLLPIILVLLFAAQVIASKSSVFKVAVPRSIRAAYIAVMIGVLVVLAPDTSPRFIYFQF